MKKCVPPSSNVHALGHKQRDESVDDLLRVLRESLLALPQKPPSAKPDVQQTPVARAKQCVHGDSNAQLTAHPMTVQTIRGNNNIQISGLQLVVSVNLGHEVNS